MPFILKSFFRKASGGTRKIRSFLPIYGFWGTLRMAVGNTLSFSIFYRMEKRLSNSEYKLVPRIPLSLKTISNLEDLTDEEKNKVHSIRGLYGFQQFVARLENSHIMFAMYANDDKLAAFVWLELPPVETAGIKVPHEMAFTYDAWTFTEYRGNRIFPVIQQNIFDYVRQNHPEVKSILTQVSIKNKASAYQDQSAGYIIVGLELSIILFGNNTRITLV